ncbi:TauD/TfdA family dioxygenase [Verrucosispora sp. WMMA2121]|uniref:TauD/TfdA family dioxygenase n=1 Tax=Verrucosispora sp. WMMA2121 TaxID=3015164 RepID=UPI0022B65AB5|nr:TauD/TfdA family dioxygenase [Verrucosispora sp. WMMA2121]MCZ7421948.1 TauD/TfdA family dioxygenase [Verrucosispora sp. WMMA2121]
MRYENNDGPLTVAILESKENREFGSLCRKVRALHDGDIDSPEWVASARTAWEDAPAGLRRTLREFRRDSGPGGALLLRNLPLDENLPATPTEDNSVLRKATVSATALMLVAHGLGDPAAFRPEKAGALVQNVVPVPGREDVQGNAGSVHLTFHTENAFHPHRPDFVKLLCVRSDHEKIAELRLVCSRQLLPKLSEEALEVLRSPRFVTAAPPSFGGASGAAEPHAVLSGDPADPDLRIDEAATVPLDGDAEAALRELSKWFEDLHMAIRLRPGDLAIVDNRVTVHGRSAFTPRYDGRDRWLQRTFVLADLRRSRSHRAGDGYVVSA